MRMSILESHRLERMKCAHAIARICVAHDSRNLGHGLDANYAFDSEVRLVGELAREVVGTELVHWHERVLHEILGPIIKDIVLFPAVTPMSKELDGGDVGAHTYVSTSDVSLVL